MLTYSNSGEEEEEEEEEERGREGERKGCCL